MFTTFATLLSGGMMLILATGRPADIAWRYYRLIGMLVVALTAVTVAWQFSRADEAAMAGRWPDVLLIGCGVGAIAATLLSALAQRKPVLLRAVLVLGGLCGIASGTMIASPIFINTSGTQASTATWLVWIATRASEALLIGSVTAAWLLGHAYLTATRMTIHPLRRFGRWLAASLSIRLILALGGVGWLLWHLPWSAASSGAESESMTVMGFVSSYWIVLSLRFVVGLVIAGVLTVMVLDCIRLRSTQSATGLLYFNSVLIYLGELSAQHLAVQTGWCF